MEVKLKIELKKWTVPSTNDTIDYFDCTSNIMGQEIKFIPKADYKRLLKMLYELYEKQKSVNK